MLTITGYIVISQFVSTVTAAGLYAKQFDASLTAVVHFRTSKFFKH